MRLQSECYRLSEPTTEPLAGGSYPGHLGAVHPRTTGAPTQAPLDLRHQPTRQIEIAANIRQPEIPALKEMR